MGKKWNKKSKITSALRQVWRWSPYPRAAKLLAKVGVAHYQCAKCKKIFHEKDIRVDHKETVVPLDWIPDDWSVYIERLFCSIEGLQILCKKDHDAKTNEERAFKKTKRLEAKSSASQPDRH